MARPDAGAATAPAGRGESETTELTRWETAVARRSAESRATVPDVDMSVTVEMSAALTRAEAEGCGLAAVYVRACALALREHPRANAGYRDGRREQFGRVNVGVVVAELHAYVIPTVFDADVKPLGEIDGELADLIHRAGDGTLLAPELSGATFTLSDLGALGVISGTPLIVAPAGAALATGAVQAVPVVRDGDIVPSQMITATLSSDHRVLYGATAAAFLRSVQTKLEEAVL